MPFKSGYVGFPISASGYIASGSLVTFFGSLDRDSYLNDAEYKAYLKWKEDRKKEDDAVRELEKVANRPIRLIAESS